MVWIVILIVQVARTHISQGMAGDAPFFATTEPPVARDRRTTRVVCIRPKKGPGWCRGLSCCVVAGLAAATAEHAELDRFGGTVGFRLCQ